MVTMGIASAGQVTRMVGFGSFLHSMAQAQGGQLQLSNTTTSQARRRVSIFIQTLHSTRQPVDTISRLPSYELYNERAAFDSLKKRLVGRHGSAETTLSLQRD